MTWGRVLGGAVATGFITLTAAAAVFARKATRITTRRADTLPVIAWNEGSVEIAATPSTLVPGTFSLYTGLGAGHARVGKVLSFRAGSVVREVEAVYRPAPAGVDRGYWSGYGYETPGDLGLDYQEVPIPTGRGRAPAWRLDGDPEVWVVHIHGLGGRRAACLRTVPVFQELGASQLVVSYAGDRDAPALKDGRHHFGLDEWHDVDAALDYAVRSGARKVILSAWSMGATIALQLLTGSRHRGLIQGVVMTSPVMDWEQTLLEQGRLAGLPDVVARAGLLLMGTRGLCRLSGLGWPLDLTAGSWFSSGLEALPPALVLHAVGDPMASYNQSQRYAAEADVELVPIDAPGHTLEWSVDQAGCANAVRTWWQHSLSGSMQTHR